jgi:hypothetical protein
MGRTGSADLPDSKSEIFLRADLDRPNHLEFTAQNPPKAHGKSSSAGLV